MTNDLRSRLGLVRLRVHPALTSAARNQALQGFGAMAILGEVACLSAAIVGLPAFILWSARRRRNGGAAAGLNGPGEIESRRSSEV